MAILKQRSGFQYRSVYTLKSPTMYHAAKQKLSFIVASMSIFAFVIGNMVGQHGWYAFWKTVLGKGDDSLIAFVGTVPPIHKIPNYAEWAKYGGNKALHTFNQVPAQVLSDLPRYDQSELLTGSASPFARQVYSTTWKGGYDGDAGSHAGVDIDAPSKTPVVSISNGVVEKVSMGDIGFGHYVMIRHPNVPDSSSPSGTTTLYSTYAHMDAVLVVEGEVVHKGQNIGTVGRTGLVFGATGYHLYFQVEKESAPYHPYWPFTSSEIKSAGLSFVQAVNDTRYQSRLSEHTLDPMVFVQNYQNYVPSSQTVVAIQSSAPAVLRSSRSSSVGRDLASLRYYTVGERLTMATAARRQARLAKMAVRPVMTSVVAETTSPVPVTHEVQTVVSDVTVASIEKPLQPQIASVSNTDVDHLEFSHSGKLSRTWQKVFIEAKNRQGELVVSPAFTGRLYLRSDFGEALIQPSELSPLDFVNGVATVNVLTKNLTKPVFIIARGAFNAQSLPMVPVR